MRKCKKKFHVKQMFCSVFFVVFQTFSTLQSPFVGCFYFVDFQMFKLSNPTRPKNIKYFNIY